MQVLDAMPSVQKTSLFGTAVHAVFDEPRLDAAKLTAALAAAGIAATSVARSAALARRRLSRRRRAAPGGRRKAMRGILAVYRKELRQIARDRRTLMILAFIPAFFLLLYGYALNFDIRNVRLAVEDRDGSTESRALVSAFVNSGYFDLAAAVYSPAEAERLLDLNDARAVLVIPEGFGREIVSGRPAVVQVLISGDNANTATTVMGYALSIAREAGTALSGRVRGRVAAPRRAAHLVQPGAAQHAVPRARADRLHRDDHRRGVDRAVDRAREGDRARSSRCGWRRSAPSRS